MSVQRYEAEADGNYATMQSCDDGDYVEYEDYVLLQMKLDDADRKLKTLESQCSTLRIENMGLKDNAIKQETHFRDKLRALGVTFTSDKGYLG